MLDPNNTFFISDPHFDHTNILKYCNRPFQTIEKMNTTILENYNRIVKDTSTVYFVGDMSFGRGSKAPKWWLRQLRGHIIYLKGSHDHGIRPTNRKECYHYLIIDSPIGDICVLHNPINVPKDWTDWTIHGHTHSSRLIDFHNKRVCVGVEATDYRPISLTQILKAIEIQRLQEIP